MDLSFYGWLWMIVGAVFVPMEVTAYVASIIKVVLDRYRIKKTNTARRQSKLTGVPSGRRLNILIINDEERAFKIMSNGHCRSYRKTDQPSTLTNAEDTAESIQQNGGPNVKVTIEYNLEVRGMSEDVALLQHDQVLKDNSFKKITGAKRSITIDGDNLITYASFSDGESKIGIVSNSGTLLSDANSMSYEPSSRYSISLPDLSPNKEHKQPPPKPKRNQSTINKKASITEVQKWSSNMQVPIIEAENKLTTDISNVDDDVPTSESDDKKSSLSADPAQAYRRYSSTSATDTDGQAIHSLPNLSRSEDCLYSPPREVHMTKSNSSQGNVNAGHFSGHTNVAFTDSSEEMKTNL